jgi:hypothetical protein
MQAHQVMEGGALCLFRPTCKRSQDPDGTSGRYNNNLLDAGLLGGEATVVVWLPGLEKLVDLPMDGRSLNYGSFYDITKWAASRHNMADQMLRIGSRIVIPSLWTSR